MLTLLMIYLLATLAIGCLVFSLVLLVAWSRSRKRVQVLALQLDAESQIEAATVQTLSAMRAAARAYTQRSDSRWMS